MLSKADPLLAGSEAALTGCKIQSGDAYGHCRMWLTQTLASETLSTTLVRTSCLHSDVAPVSFTRGRKRLHSTLAFHSLQVMLESTFRSSGHVPWLKADQSYCLRILQRVVEMVEVLDLLKTFS